MNWIDRYISQVIGYLPESEQAEVKQELYSNIMDMLPEEPTEAEAKEVLNSLGDPKKLAEEYRQSPNYLIGPEVYNDYLRTLKIILPVAAVIGFIVGGISTYFDEIITGISVEVFTNVLSEAISSGIFLALQGAVWITIGFVIFERTGFLKPKKDHWQVENLAELPTVKKISLGDIVAELAIQIALIVFLIFGNFSLTQTASGINMSVFETNFADFATIVIVFCCLVDIAVSIFKWYYRRWNKVVTISSIVSILVSAGGFIWICSQREIFSVEFRKILESRTWSDGDVLRFFNHQTGTQGLPTEIFYGIVGVCGVITIISIIMSLYHYNKQRQSDVGSIFYPVK